MAYVQVYSCDGKGKTTAAIGLAVRAVGAGMKVLFLQFMKEKSYSEHTILKYLSPNLTLIAAGKPNFVIKTSQATEQLVKKYHDRCVVFEPGHTPPAYVKLVAEALNGALEAAQSGRYDLIVLDELNCALYFGLAAWADVLPIIRNRAPNTELIFTGRGAPPELLVQADLVTEFKSLKPYYETGVEARIGIEM